MVHLAWILIAALMYSPGASASSIKVSVKAFSEVALPVEGSAAAAVLSPNDSHISADVTARVATVHAEVGSTVKKGQALLELDAADYRLALAQADAQLASAQANLLLAEQRLARATELREKQFTSDDEVLAQKTLVQAAKAQQQIADATRKVAARNVEKCRVIAPFDGVITGRMAQVGSLATSGSPLLRMVDLAPPEVEAHVQAIDAAGLRSANGMTFESQGRSWPVQLRRLSPVVETNTRTQVARLGFTHDNAAPAGSSGTLRWRSTTRALPASVMVKRGNALGAFVLRDGKARFIAAPEAQQGRPFAMALPANTPIIIEGQQGLRDGDTVTANTQDEAH